MLLTVNPPEPGGGKDCTHTATHKPVHCLAAWQCTRFTWATCGFLLRGERKQGEESRLSLHTYSLRIKNILQRTPQCRFGHHIRVGVWSSAFARSFVSFRAGRNARYPEHSACYCREGRGESAYKILRKNRPLHTTMQIRPPHRGGGRVIGCCKAVRVLPCSKPPRCTGAKVLKKQKRQEYYYDCLLCAHYPDRHDGIAPPHPY